LAIDAALAFRVMNKFLCRMIGDVQVTPMGDDRLRQQDHFASGC
jgi:hypothetical protein